MSRRISKRAVFRLLPAALIGLIPFGVLDDALLQALYTLRGTRAPSAPLTVVVARPEDDIARFAHRAAAAGYTHILQISEKERALPPVTTLSVGDLYTLPELEALAPDLARQIGTEAAPHFRTLFAGPLENFHPQSATIPLNQAPAPALLIVLAPHMGKEPVVATAAGGFGRYEVLINMISNLMDGRSLKAPPRWAAPLAAFLSAGLTAWIVYSYPILLTSILVCVLALVEFALGLIFFDQFGWQIPLAAPLAATLAAWMLGMSERLARRERREWALERDAENLRSLDEMRTNFLSLVSHDLKTPIALIRSVLDRFTRGDFGPVSESQRASLETISSASGFLQRTISTLLLLGRIESKEISLRLEPSDLNEILKEAVERIRPQARERGIQIETQFEPLFLANLDRALIAEVASNLIDNALKYSPPKSHILIRSGEFDNCPGLSPPQPGVFFEVRDEGPGIAKADRTRVLGKFVKGHNESLAADQSVKGTGLGLYLSKYFVERHGGRLSLLSRTPGEEILDGDPVSEYFGDKEHGTVVCASLPLETPVDAG